MNTIQTLFVSSEEYKNLRTNDKALASKFYDEICHKSGDSKHKSFKVGFPKNVAGWYVIGDKAGKDFMAKWEPQIDANQAVETVDPTPTIKVPKGANKAAAAPSSDEILATLIEQYNELSKKAKKSPIDKKLIAVIEAKIEAL